MPKFRWWTHNLWIDNCEEKILFGGEKYTFQEYWNKYQSWLISEYRKHRKLEKERNETRRKYQQWTR